MIMDSIFKKVLESKLNGTGLDVDKDLFKMDWGFGNKEEAPKEDKKVEKDIKKAVKKGAVDLKNLVSKGFARSKDKKETASDDKKKIAKNLRKDKDVTINKLISKRFVPTDEEGKYSVTDLKNYLDEYKGDTEVEIPSTAIADVRYDPKTKVCHVKYVGGNKWYRFVNMTPQQFKSFMNSSSKGRYVQRIMRHKNHDPAYPRTI